MNPITHFLVGWCLANSAQIESRDRAWVTLAGVLPDLDGLGAVVDLASRGSSWETELYVDYHHVLGHGLVACLALTALAAWRTRRPWVSAPLVALSFHLHLLGDLVGSRGPDGYQWPLPYLAPFDPSVQLTWSGQWGLASWQNTLVSLLLIALTLWLARRRGFSFLELLWPRGDRELVKALRRRFPVEEAAVEASEPPDPPAAAAPAPPPGRPPPPIWPMALGLLGLWVLCWGMHPAEYPLFLLGLVWWGYRAPPRALAWLLLSPVLLVWPLGMVQGALDWSRGTVTLHATAREGFGQSNLDPETRCPGTTPGSLRLGWEFAVGPGYNLGVRQLVRRFGYPPGAYDGPYPDRTQVRTLLDRGGRAPRAEEWERHVFEVPGLEGGVSLRHLGAYPGVSRARLRVLGRRCLLLEIPREDRTRAVFLLDLQDYRSFARYLYPPPD